MGATSTRWNLPRRFSSTTRNPTKSRIFGVSVGRRTDLQSLESDLKKGGIILELLFDQKLWNDQELNRNVVFEYFAVADIVIVCTSVLVIVSSEGALYVILPYDYPAAAPTF